MVTMQLFPPHKCATPGLDVAAALAYRDDQFVFRYATKQGVSFDLGEHRFQELKKFLVICALTEEGASPSDVMDTMWHEFILHTRSYQCFCDALGTFIHHNPTESPVLGNRVEVLAMAKELFGTIDDSFWPALGATACDSSCGGDNYCSGDKVNTVH
jgi:hypothetical protein